MSVITSQSYAVPGLAKMLGKFGMLEMEAAAARIVIVGSSWANIEDMRSEQERTGYLHLLMGGFIEWGGTYNEEFRPTQKFWDRIKEQP